MRFLPLSVACVCMAFINPTSTWLSGCVTFIFLCFPEKGRPMISRDTCHWGKSWRYWIQHGGRGGSEECLTGEACIFPAMAEALGQTVHRQLLPKTLLHSLAGKLSSALSGAASLTPPSLPCQCCLQKMLSEGNFQKQLETPQKCL